MALAQLINEGKYGETARSVNELIDKLTSINWYSKAGQYNLDVEGKLARFIIALGVHNYEIKWITKEQVAETIGKLSFENSDLWEVLKELPDQFRKKIDSLGYQQLLNDVVDKVPEAVFHGAYKHAYEAFKDEDTIKFLVGHAMYISILACTAELADEKEKMSILLDLLEEGHLPLGPQGNTFYLL
jgi:NADH dehydrogenase/NADH:ubiquinone oxidoreductase subunit G